MGGKLHALVFASAFLVVAGCGGEPVEGAAAQSQDGAEASAAAVSDATRAQEEEAVNLLTLAEGAVLLSASANEHEALSLTDGAQATNWSVGGRRHTPPFVFVFELRAPTRLSHVGVEGAGARPGGVAGAAAQSVLIEASAEGSDAGYVELGRVDAADEGETLIDVASDNEFRWLRYTIESNHGAAQWTYLDGVAAYGAQTPPSGETRFSGVYRVGRADVIELKQSGASVVGCYTEQSGNSVGEISGAVRDGVARLAWRSERGVTGAALMVVDSAGALSGVRYRDRSRSAWGGPPAPEGTTSPCSTEEPAANPISAALQEEGEVRIYDILFDFDRATLKSSSGPALRQLLEALEATPSLIVDVEGHTDWVGDDAYNLELSLERARSVVAWLVERGVAEERLNAVGKGESTPVASNDTADGRVLNRRVEVRRRS